MGAAVTLHDVPTDRLRFEGEQLIERGFFGNAIAIRPAGDREEQPNLRIGAAALRDCFETRAGDGRLPTLECIDAFFREAFGIVIAQLQNQSFRPKKRGRNNVPTPNLFRSRCD